VESVSVPLLGVCGCPECKAFNRKIFPHISPEAVEVPIEGSALDRIRQKRAEQELMEQAAV
jgi:hypothetical protein